MARDPGDDEIPTGPEPAGGAANSDLNTGESADVDPPDWDGSATEEEDQGPRLVDPRPEIPGPAGL